MNFLKLIRQPNINMVAGIKVTKDTDITYENETVKQTIKDLVFNGVTKIKGDKYEGENKITVYLNEGDYVVYDGDERGYVVPAQKFMTIEEAIHELDCVSKTFNAPEKENENV